MTAATCAVIANSISSADIQSNDGPQWRSVVDFALKSSSILVQEAVADALAAVSKLADCSSYVQR